MRPSPSIVPGVDRDTYLILDEFGRIGCAWRETNVEDTELESVINDLKEGQYSNIPSSSSASTRRKVGRGTCLRTLPASCANAAPIRTANCQSFLGDFVDRYESANT